MTGIPGRFAKPDYKVIDRDPANLHPVMRSAVREVLLMCQAELLPFQMFEGFRSPQRQQHLYMQGRVPSRPGKILTQAKEWHSYHQYGLAADFALMVNGDFNFDTSPANDWLWTRLREIGQDYGLEGIENQKEHLQYATLELAELQKGKFPGGGDRSWEENLRTALERYPK